jgi:hypothetical protein
VESTKKLGDLTKKLMESTKKARELTKKPWVPPINRRNDQEFQDKARTPRRINEEENKFGKLKFTMPKFKGEDDTDAYLSWALKVDMIFHVHNYFEEKKVAMSSLEFVDYANVWWEQVVEICEENLQDPIATWEEMKSEMHKRFIPKHYICNLFNKLQKLTQGTKSVEEYFKETKMIMMRARVDELQEQTIARLFNGLNFPIKRIVEFLPYTTLVELVHQASQAEGQVQEDAKHERTKAFFASRNALASTMTVPKAPYSTSSKTISKPPQVTPQAQELPSTASLKASMTPLKVTCFKCGVQAHKSFECNNTRVMITRDNGTINYGVQRPVYFLSDLLSPSKQRYPHY